MSLKRKALGGVKWTSLSTIFNALVQLLQIVILSRYLSPDAFGQVALVMVVIGFSQLFADLGISNAIIHQQKVTHVQLSTLYWLNVLTGLVLFVGISIFAPYISLFYHDPSLTPLIVLMAVTLLIQALGKQFFVLFEKELQFNTVAGIDIFAVLVGFLTSIYLAINHFGVYALVYPYILTVTIKSVLYIVKGLQFHRPSFYFRVSEVKSFINFGLFQMGSGFVGYFNSQFDIIIIGKLFGQEVLGMYSLAKQLVMRPAQIVNPIVTRVTFPVLAKVQDDQTQLKEIYLKTIYLISLVNFPIYLLMLILAPEIISLFLGEKWADVVPIFQVLTLFALFRSTGNPIGTLVLAKGRPQYELYWNIGLFFYLPLTIYIGSFCGVTGVAWAMSFSMASLIVPNWYFLVYRLCGATFWEYHKQIIKPIVLAGFAAFISFGISLNIESSVIKLIGISLLNIVIYWILLYKFAKDFILMMKGFKE